MTLSLNNEGHDTMTSDTPAHSTLAPTLRTNRVSGLTKLTIWEMVSNAAQPITIDEITAATRQLPGKKNYAWYTCYRAVQELIRDGLLFARDVTHAERALSGRKHSGRPRLLIWDAAVVPHRTIDEVIPGIQWSKLETQNPSTIKKNKRRRLAKDASVQTGIKQFKAVRPAMEAVRQTGNRFERLEARIVELEKALEDLRNMLT